MDAENDMTGGPDLENGQLKCIRFIYLKKKCSDTEKSRKLGQEYYSRK